jgi:hypothetical protein
VNVKRECGVGAWGLMIDWEFGFVDFRREGNAYLYKSFMLGENFMHALVLCRGLVG